MGFILVKNVHERNDIYLQSIPEIKYLPNNILVVSRKIIFSKCNEYDFLRSL